jgi:transcriptional regulator with GAF, ATPase, and Fis domain
MTPPDTDHGAFERLLTDISTRFVNAPPGRVDNEIVETLRLLVEFLGVERSTLFQWSPDGQGFENTHQYVAEGCAGAPRLIGQEVLPHSIGRLLQGHVFSFTSLAELPADATVDRATFETYGPKSNLSLPLIVAGTVVGALAFGTLTREREWPDALRDRLASVAHVFANALDRKRSDLELHRAYAEVTALKERLELDNRYLRQELATAVSDDAIVAQSVGMRSVLREVRRVAATDSTVLLYGETGTGKELLAEAVHNGSKRKERLLVRVNCAALPGPLIESELFGREKGAYTGALSKEAGRFGAADGGTLFLDEVGELPLELQAKLLRVLETGTFERLGSSRTVKVDVRLVTATNCDLRQAVRENRFRQDLFFRLQVFPIHIPPLRERREDIPPLVWTFVKQFGQQLGHVIEQVPRQAMDALVAYSWPGNIRELRNVIERSMILTDGPTLQVVLPDGSAPAPAVGALGTLEEAERAHILQALERTRWRISGEHGAARILGLKPTTLEYRMKKHGIERRSLPAQ